MFVSGMGTGSDAIHVLDLLARTKSIRLEANPWEMPPAPVVDRGIDAMRKYYDEVAKVKPVLIDSRKIVFIGYSGAGKTRYATIGGPPLCTPWGTS